MPTPRSDQINWTLRHLMARDRREAILCGECVSCGNMALIFSGDLGRREFEVSGLCEACQDTVLEKEDEG